MEEQWAPLPTRYAVDKDGRIGRVQSRYLGSVYLRPPGGGKEWAVPPEELRRPTAEEMNRVRVFITPVQAVER
ncbi:hypothetical protein C5L38_12890 [Streptomyces sp. WAC00288]|uniref:hypothetical protein n=1 Tax=unclassified Streptomyces TaxID=2593676 RepID=UPI0007892784|nr:MULTISPECIES: hypothetical protein [unclassified Streptomyces]AVH95860.1 hypothetical protein C5L38_12890 [Streptomyces sp. WAC00288]KYG54523.1 hypothetical protein AWI43_08705 [Streptomyces sp. WAC04657]